MRESLPLRDTSGEGAVRAPGTRPATPFRGFTLIELLVVIAIIAILAAILFPVFAQAREQARQTGCSSNVRQIGLAVQMYLQDYDETLPLFYAYNTQTPTGLPAREGDPSHKGVEMLLLPYTKNKAIFACPDDLGGPTLSDPALGCPGRSSYLACYGSSYRFSHGVFSVAVGESSQNNQVYTDPRDGRIETLAALAFPAETRLMRDEMFPFFGTDPKYGYIPGYFQTWHSRGGGTVFADGHAKYTASAGQFDREVVCPDGGRSGDLDPNAATDRNSGNTYYWLCD